MLTSSSYGGVRHYTQAVLFLGSFWEEPYFLVKGSGKDHWVKPCVQILWKSWAVHSSPLFVVFLNLLFNNWIQVKSNFGMFSSKELSFVQSRRQSFSDLVPQSADTSHVVVVLLLVKVSIWASRTECHFDSCFSNCDSLTDPDHPISLIRDTEVKVRSMRALKAQPPV